MGEDKNGKGFSGFDDLVSDVSKDLEQAKQTPASANATARKTAPVEAPPQRKPVSQPASSPIEETKRESSPIYHSSAGSSGSGSAGKWIVGIIGFIIFISWINSSGNKKGNSYQQPPASLSLPNTVYAPPSQPAPQTTYAPSKAQEVIPPVGRSNVLSYDQIRYCLSEKVRMNAVHNALDKYSEYEVNLYNNMVSDYNSRCGEYRYRRGALQSVQKDVDANRYALEIEGLARIGR